MLKFGATPVILLACQPKSASTFLRDCIAKRAGGRVSFLSASRGRGEQEFDRLKVRKAKFARSPLLVSQQHIRHSGSTQKVIDKYGLSVVVLRRNLFDVVCSIRDHVRNEGPEFPVFYCDSKYTGLPDSDLEVLIARMAIPWYLNFHMSWKQAPGVLDVHFEDVKSRPGDVVEEVLDRIGFPAEKRQQVSEYSPRDSKRLNKGVSGRGMSMSQDAKDTVRALVQTYADIDNDPYLAGHLT